jgi:hypothetical protein
VKWLIGFFATIGILIAAACGATLLDLPIGHPGDDPLLSPLPRPQPGV